jgi:hypothetical protein
MRPSWAGCRLISSASLARCAKRSKTPGSGTSVRSLASVTGALRSCCSRLRRRRGVDPASLLVTMLQKQYLGAAVEEFPTARAAGAGVRRCETLRLPSGGADGGPLIINVGISQALVPFPEAGLLGQVTGCSFRPEDVDMATVFTATIAYHLTVAPATVRSATVPAP